jgi:hypothetical protein
LAIESASFISDLNSSNPPGSDPVGQADDHIRLLKSVLKSTFPNLTGAVTSTQSQLNGALVPTGCILMWSGATTSVPTGWALCDGGTYSKSDGSGSVTVPDLRNRFVVGAGSTYAVSSTGGATSNTPTITVTNEAVALSTNQLPAHGHSVSISDPGHSHSISDPGHTHTQNILSTGGSGSWNSWAPGFAGGIPSLNATASATTGITVASNSTGISATANNTGSGATHVHNNTAVSSAVSTLPPYLALAYIYKL